MGVLDQRFEKNFMITSVDYVFNWARKSALWPLTFGLACCAIEMIASTTDRKSTRLNSSHGYISYAVFCLKKKNDRRHYHSRRTSALSKCSAPLSRSYPSGRCHCRSATRPCLHNNSSVLLRCDRWSSST